MSTLNADLLRPARAAAGRRLAGALAAVLAVLGVLGVAAPVASAFTAQLRRYPYLTDASAAGITVNWATDRTLTAGSVKWGGPGETCTAHSATATRTNITVNGVAEYQWTMHLGLSANTTYCYRVFGGTTDLLATDASPKFTTQLPAGSTAPFSFAILGDWGLNTASG